MRPKMDSRTIYARIRGGVIIKRGRWSHNATFGRCKFCDSLTIHGRCIKCCEAIRCASCRKVRTTECFVDDPLPLMSASDTICGVCAEKLYPEIWARIQTRRNNEGVALY